MTRQAVLALALLCVGIGGLATVFLWPLPQVPPFETVR